MRGILIENPVIFVDMNIPEYSHSQSRRANVTIFCRIRDCTEMNSLASTTTNFDNRLVCVLVLF